MSGPLKNIRQRYLLFYTHKGQCAWCRRPTILCRRMSFDSDIENLPFQATCDHVIVKSKGGSNFVENMVLACMECNQERKDTDFDVWHAIMYKRGLNPQPKFKMRRKAKYAGMLHRFMTARNMPLCKIDEAACQMRERELRRLENA